LFLQQSILYKEKQLQTGALCCNGSRELPHRDEVLVFNGGSPQITLNRLKGGFTTAVLFFLQHGFGIIMELIDHGHWRVLQT